MPSGKRTNAVSASTYQDVLKILGLTRLDAFRRADLTRELRKEAKIAPEDEHRLTACAELTRLGLPAEAAQALAFSGAIGSASEFASLTIAELERVLQEAPVKRLLPSTFNVDVRVLEDWIRLATPLTADESAPGRSAVPEVDTVALARDDDTPLAAEDIMLTADRAAALLSSLKQSWSRTEASMEALAGAKAGMIDSIALRAALADLQDGIAGALERAVNPVAGGFLAADEDVAASEADEALDPATEVVRLRGELTRVEATIQTLQAAVAGGLEASSPTAASESGASEREAPPRRE